MKLLIIILLLPLATFAHRYRISSDPNDAPFLPIFPIHPYTPKLIKRGTDKDHLSGQINSELYAPKLDARDSYSINYNGNYQKDSHPSTPSQNIYSTAYTSPSQAFSQSTTYTPGSSIPSQYHNVNPYLYAIYNGYPVTLMAQSPSINPGLPNNYFYQQYQQYSPNYHHSYSSTVGSSQFNHESNGKHYGKYQDITKNKLNLKDGQFIDGTNYLTHPKELDVSASTYRLPSHLNQDNDASDLNLRSAQLPKTMFRIVPYDGQQIRQANYPTTVTFKHQNLDQQLMNQAVGKVLGQSSITNIAQNPYDIVQSTPNLSGKFSAPSPTTPIIAKTGLAYVMNPMSFNIAPRHIAKSPDNYQTLDSSSSVSIRGRKPMTTVSVEGSHGIYIPPLKFYKNHAQLLDYSDYISQNGQIYNNPISTIPSDYKKNEQNYVPDEVQTGQSDQSHQYQYSGYQPTLTDLSQMDNYKITLDDVNYASKRTT